MKITYQNPDIISQKLRPLMMKDGKYLIPKIAGAGQDPGEKKILSEYFRYKDYIHNPEWHLASPSQRWETCFLGFKHNWQNLPFDEAKKVEFQNPPYSAAWRLRKDPKDYCKVFTAQVAGCDYDCNYCFVPKSINIGNPECGRYFSSQEIVENFLEAKGKSESPMNVIRISGGNPTIIPEIIIDIFLQMEERLNDAYLWIDTNLSTPRYMEELGAGFKDLVKQKNVGFVGCFKGVCEEDFATITGADPKFYSRQFETARWLVENGADFYAYLPALVYGENVEQKLLEFAQRQISINKNLPLRVEIIGIIDFPGAIQNYARAAKQGRPMPENDQRKIFEIWHNKILPSLYPPSELEKFQCQIKLT